ncbi:MAG: GspMb/PilO family protein [Vicinamibacteria bacterium]
MTRRVKWLLALFGLNAAVFLTFTLPRTLEERSLASRAATLRAEVEREERAVSSAKERAEILLANGRDTDRFYRDVVKGVNEDLLPTLQYIEKAAQELGLTAANRSYSPEEVKGLGLVRFSITMPMSGPYKQIVALLDRLERSSRFLVVDQIQLRARTDVGADLTFVLSAYFKAEPGSHGST